jgi:hypothetical protein
LVIVPGVHDKRGKEADMSYPFGATLQPGFYAVDGFGTAQAGPSVSKKQCEADAVTAGLQGAFTVLHLSAPTVWNGWMTTSVPGDTITQPDAVPILK